MPPNTRQHQCRIHETVAFTWQPVFPKNSWWPKDTKQLKFWCIMRHLEYKQVTQVTESEQTCIILIFQMSATCSHLLGQPLAATCPVSHLQPLAATWQPLGRHLLQWLQQVAAKWLQVAASGCQVAAKRLTGQVAAKWLPSAILKKKWFCRFYFFFKFAASGCQTAGTWLQGARGCQVAASGCKWLQVAASGHFAATAILKKKQNL